MRIKKNKNVPNKPVLKELNTKDTYPELTIISKEDFIRKQNVHSYIEFLLKIALQISDN